MVYSNNYLNTVVRHSCYQVQYKYMSKKHQVSISSPFEALALPVFFSFK